MRRRLGLLLGVAIVATAVALTAIWAYSAHHLRALRGQALFATPEDGMRALVASSYYGVDRVEIAKVGKVVFEELCFVAARVWAAGRVSGGRMKDQSYDNPGWHFLYLGDGWVRVTEGRFPELIALGRWLFGP